MRAYMKDISPFLGIPSPVRRKATKGLKRPPDSELLVACCELFALTEREYHYVAIDALDARAKHLPASALHDLLRLVQTKSWWDTVDGLAGCIGGLVTAHPILAVEIEGWIHHEDFWVQRVAILHQLRYKERTDVERLFRLCLVHASSREFFIRKAIGWALRQYAWTDPEAIRSFVEAHRSEFSGLTVREADRKSVV